jgi:hypothetical protein
MGKNDLFFPTDCNSLKKIAQIYGFGEMAEWSNAAVSKTVVLL